MTIWAGCNPQKRTRPSVKLIMRAVALVSENSYIVCIPGSLGRTVQRVCIRSALTRSAYMEILPDLRQVTGLGTVDDGLQAYRTERCATNFDQQAPSASNATLFPGSPSTFTVELDAYSRLTPTEQSQSSEDCRTRSAAAECHPSSQSLHSCKGFPLHVDTRDVVPAAKSWVISNRKVQKRYRERQKVRAMLGSAGDCCMSRALCS